MADLGTSLASILQIPGLQSLLNTAITQENQMAPVRTGLAQQAANMLPNSAFPGGRPNIAAIPQANYTTPAPSSSSSLSSALPWLMAGVGGAGLLAKLFGNQNNMSGLLSLLKAHGIIPQGQGPWATGDNPAGSTDPNPPSSLDPNYTPPGQNSNFNFGVGGGDPSGANLDSYSFYNPASVQNPANPNASAFGGAPVGGPDQQTQAGRKPQAY